MLKVAIVFYLLSGQTKLLHLTVSSVNPTQSAPPLAGAGSSQALVLLDIPPPQVTLQEPQSAHPLQIPSTANQK